MTKNLKNVLAIACAFFLVVSLANAGDIVPNSFSKGDVVSASKMNQNFAELENAFGDALSWLYLRYDYTVDDRGVYANVSDGIYARCNAGEVLVTATVSCISSDFDPSTTNWGLVNDQSIYYDSDTDEWYVYGECSSDALLYDSSKYGPAVKICLICGSTGTVGEVYAASSSNSRSVYQPDNADVPKPEISDGFTAFLKEKKRIGDLRGRYVK